MKKKQAIEIIAYNKLKELSNEERTEQLDIMSLEDWTDNKDWKLLSKEIRDEFLDGKPVENPNSEKYNQVLLIWIKHGLRSVTNNFLKNILGIHTIEGEPIKLSCCPCCGSRTIEERGNFEICNVCWWEDDGQDNESADKIYGGPNYGISLTQGRNNFLKFGLYDPERKDLMNNKEPISKYLKGREFAIDGKFVIEKGTNWKAKIHD